MIFPYLSTRENRPLTENFSRNMISLMRNVLAVYIVRTIYTHRSMDSFRSGTGLGFAHNKRR